VPPVSLSTQIQAHGHSQAGIQAVLCLCLADRLQTDSDLVGRKHPEAQNERREVGSRGSARRL
jgi:hypothetical protein